MTITNTLKFSSIISWSALIIATIVFVCCNDSDIPVCGWHNNLKIMGIYINTPYRYFGLMGFIAYNSCVSTYIIDAGKPILGFRIFNPDLKVITDIKRNELRAYAASIYFSDSMCSTLLQFIIINQLDLLIWRVFVAELVAIWTINNNLRDKAFTLDDDYSPINDPTEMV